LYYSPNQTTYYEVKNVPLILGVRLLYPSLVLSPIISNVSWDMSVLLRNEVVPSSKLWSCDPGRVLPPRWLVGEPGRVEPPRGGAKLVRSSRLRLTPASVSIKLIRINKH
jgi:hypothetical protein